MCGAASENAACPERVTKSRLLPAFDAAAAQGRWLGNYSTGPMFYPGSAWLRSRLANSA